MKIVLVFPPFYLESMYNLPPLGIISLATGLADTGHQAVIIDFVLELRRKGIRSGKRIYEDCTERILAEDPDVVGFSAQCTTYPPVIQIARKVKDARSDTKIIIGGHNASFVDRLTLEKYPWIDCIVRGEGEITFKELVDSYEKGKNGEGILGITYRDYDQIIENPDRMLISDLDSLPIPDYTLVPPLAEYKNACELPRSIAILEVGRGCPHNCIYCSESKFWKRRSRTYSVDRIVGEMKVLHEKHEAECFVLAYDQFTANSAFVKEFCRKVKAENMNHVPWYCISRLDTLDGELLDLMREAGCESMCFGIDSGSPKTLSFIRKNINRDILYWQVEETTRRGIIPTLSYIIGFPEEEKEDIDATLNLALQTGILGNNNPLLQIPTVLPGTDLYKKYCEQLTRKVDTYFSLGIEFNNGTRLESDERLIDDSPEIFSSFYNIPCKGMPLDQLNIIASYFPFIVNFYPRSFYLLSLECEKSVSDLFLEWLLWVNDRLERNEITLTPQDCYLHFESYARSLLEQKGKVKRKYVFDLLRYETNCLEVAKWDVSGKEFKPPRGNLSDTRPVKSSQILVEEFSFNIPLIIEDMKKDRVKESYPEEVTILVFKHENKQLVVNEINNFGRDMLELCNGRNSLKHISDSLYPRYGSGMSREDFFESCIEALEMLGEMKYLTCVTSCQPAQAPGKGGEINA